MAIAYLTSCEAIQNTTASSFGGASLGASNPFSKKPKASENTKATAKKQEPADDRGFVPVVDAAKLEKTKDGYILRVSGTLDRTGYFGVELVEQARQPESTDKTLVYEFRAYVPETGLDVNTARSKKVIAAVFIPSETYVNAQGIKVVALQNTLTVGR